MLDHAQQGAKPDSRVRLVRLITPMDSGTYAPTLSSNVQAPRQLWSMSWLAPRRTGLSVSPACHPAGNKLEFDVGQFNRTVVLGNHVVFGSVNANRRHYRAAADALARADKRWLSRLITRQVPLTRWREAFERRDGDIKVVLDFNE